MNGVRSSAPVSDLPLRVTARLHRCAPLTHSLGSRNSHTGRINVKLSVMFAAGSLQFSWGLTMNPPVTSRNRASSVSA